MVPSVEYERVREDARHFLVAPGHEIPDVEVVVERNEAYYVVEKSAPDAERVAEATDPRA
jgi:hypothetical protein